MSDDSPTEEKVPKFDVILPVGVYLRAEAIERAQSLIKAGKRVYYKYQCEKCQTKCCFTEPNVLYEAGICPNCEHITTIQYAGFTIVTDIGSKFKPTAIKKGKKNVRKFSRKDEAPEA